jgi:hypothetical protein
VSLQCHFLVSLHLIYVRVTSAMELLFFAYKLRFTSVGCSSRTLLGVRVWEMCLVRGDQVCSNTFPTFRINFLSVSSLIAFSIPVSIRTLAHDT